MLKKPRGLPLTAFGIFLLAATVGTVGGFLGWAFLQAVDAMQQLFLGQSGPVFRAGMDAPWWRRLLAPTAGGLCAGLILLVIRNRRGPFGIADVMELVLARRGWIHPVRSLMQIASSACSIASGGSIGREGANSQFGATIGAVLGRVFRCSSRTNAVLLGCGIAAGMASAYKAPIAGAMFVMEVVLGNFAMDVFAPVVVASVTSTLVTYQLSGKAPIYESGFALPAGYEWPLVLATIALGALCGTGGKLFRWSLEAGRSAFERVPLPLAGRMMLGGLLVGCIGLWLPEVWGNGQNTIRTVFDDAHLGVELLASLLVWKIVATSITVGSGGLGGVFTPNLFVGAAFGAAFGMVVHWLFPFTGDNHRAFALIGMAGLCAATTHAPITAIILVFELTGDYGLIQPLMLCAIIASITSRVIDRDSIYSARLRARGHEVERGIEELAMHSNYVRDVMRSDTTAVAETAPFDDVLGKFQNARVDHVYVTDARGDLLGNIHLHDVKFFINDASLGTVVIAADLTRPTPQTTADESLAAIMARFDDPDLDELPVVRSATDHRLIGRITRRDLVARLSEEVLGQRTMRARLRADGAATTSWVELPAGVELVRVAVPDALVGRALDSLDLAATHGITPVVLIERREDGTEHRRLPEPGAVLPAGSSLVVIGDRAAIETFESSSQ